MTILDNLNQLTDKAYKTAVEHGWHDDDHADKHWLMMITTEIAEAVQAHRKSRFIPINHQNVIDNEEFLSDSCFFDLYAKYLSSTFEDEIADIVIRILDFSGLNKWQLGEHIYSMEDELQNIEDYRKYAREDLTIWAFDVTQKVLSMEAATLDTDKMDNALDAIELCIAASQIFDFNLKEVITAKMRYNDMRPYRHRCKY